jgi:hypothetical protein
LRSSFEGVRIKKEAHIDKVPRSSGGNIYVENLFNFLNADALSAGLPRTVGFGAVDEKKRTVLLFSTFSSRYLNQKTRK